MEGDIRWLDEVALHRAVIRGDQEAFAELMRRYDPIVRKQLARGLDDQAVDAEVADFWCAQISDELRALRVWHANLGGPLGQWLMALAAHARATRLQKLAKRAA